MTSLVVSRLEGVTRLLRENLLLWRDMRLAPLYTSKRSASSRAQQVHARPSADISFLLIRALGLGVEWEEVSGARKEATARA